MENTQTSYIDVLNSALQSTRVPTALARGVRYALHEFLQEYTTLPSLGSCSRHIVDSITNPSTKITTKPCRSPHACPLCTPKWLANKRTRIMNCLCDELSRGRRVFLVTLTLPFPKGSSLSVRYRLLLDVWTSLMQSRFTKALRRSMNLGYIRVLEETFADGFFFPHIHAFFILDDSPHTAKEIYQISNSWVEMGLKHGVFPKSHGQSVDEVKQSEVVRLSRYVLKHQYIDLGFDAMNWSESVAIRPIQLLQTAAAKGDFSLLECWREFEQSSFRLRRISHSRNLARGLH